MGYTFFYVPRKILWVSYSGLAAGIISCLGYLGLLLTIDFNSHRMLMLGTVVIFMISIGYFLCTLSIAVLLENTCRRNNGRSHFLALNRFGSWIEDSFWFAQVVNAAFAVLGCGLLFFGAFTTYRLLR
jgi:hypothetical protein